MPLKEIIHWTILLVELELYVSGSLEFTLCFTGVRVAQCLSFCPVSFGHCVISLSSISDYHLGIFKPPITTLVSSNLWLPLWYLQTTDYHFGIFKPLITTLVSSNLWLPLRCLHTADYHLGVFKLLITT